MQLVGWYVYSIFKMRKCKSVAKHEYIVDLKRSCLGVKI